jgi:uncharacterized membrane protein YdbT with pleckstrin-like domain
VLALLGDDRFRPPPLVPRSEVARRRAVVRRVVAVAVLAAVPAVVLRPVGLVLLVLAGLGVPWGRAAHRRAGWGTSAATIALAHGVLHHRLDLVPLDRLQSTSTSASPLQRRASLATVHVDVAGSSAAPSLFDVERGAALDLARRAALAAAPPLGR